MTWSAHLVRWKPATAALLLAAIFCPGAKAADKVTLLLDWVPSGPYSFLYGGAEAGIFKSQGIELEIKRGFGSSDTVSKLAAGTGDFGTGGIAAAMLAKAQSKSDVVAILPLYVSGPHAIFTLAKSGIKSFKDLEGRKVATSPYTSSNIFWPAVLKANNVDAGKIQIVHMEAGVLTSALATGNVDAIIEWTVNRPDIDRIVSSRGQTTNVMTFAGSGVDVYELSLLASKKRLDANPDLAKRVVKATVESVYWCRDHIDDCAAALKKSVPESDLAGNVAGMRESLALMLNPTTEKLGGFGKFNAEHLAGTWTAVAQSQGLDAGIDPQSFIDVRFLP
ncbi:ABC transporter substrate-binding protein [Telmatospirillum sp.]|uniref:ABC transporter substrate-binding protein n=1 Tax=Telmatospirillum sp. TaxID=2079197 RepID=UPI002843B23F|nr:ABC transporter substrate-binding protein [Telmatospirillum sp.]MDR3437911.1 ABC transporter substrate-binding protein [Telmatospirillum sp.]